MNWIRPQFFKLLTLTFFVGVLVPASANNEFADDYMLYWQENFDGDEALELGELQQAMAHYQKALNQLKLIAGQHPDQDADLVRAKTAEVEKKIEQLHLQEVNPAPDQGQQQREAKIKGMQDRLRVLQAEEARLRALLQKSQLEQSLLEDQLMKLLEEQPLKLQQE